MTSDLRPAVCLRNQWAVDCNLSEGDVGELHYMSALYVCLTCLPLCLSHMSALYVHFCNLSEGDVGELHAPAHFELLQPPAPTRQLPQRRVLQPRMETVDKGRGVRRRAMTSCHWQLVMVIHGSYI